jgi:medium-chain acyl-[acyl-carrier-protein] hydrolase
MSVFYEDIYKVRSYEVDFNNKLKPASFFNYMQDLASVHAGKLGFGYEDLYKQDLFWVLSWVKLEIEQYPAFEEVVKVRTWPRGFYKFYALRDVLFFNKNDEIIARMRSAWILLKGDTKRPKDLRSFNIPIPYDETVSALDVYPEKIRIPEGAPYVELSRKTVYSDIDINQHLNNSKYIEIISDILEERGSISGITVNFSMETKMGEMLETALYREEEGDVVLMTSKERGRVLQAYIEYRK